MNQETQSLIASFPSAPEISEELVTLIRGFFATPVICGLGRQGALEIMGSRPLFDLQEFPRIPNKKLLQHSFHYLTRIGLLECVDPEKQLFRATENGKQIFRRWSSFYAPHSYRDYLQNYERELLHAGPYQKQGVDRLENIIGSGRTHERYFPPAVSFLRRRVQFDWIADIGCGDGRFLDFVLTGIPKIRAVGIDLSEISVRETAENLKKKHPGRNIQTFSADASDIGKWNGSLARIVQTDRLAISMWFLLHEISRLDPENIVRFLNEVHRLFPKAPLVVGELVRQDPTLLTAYRKKLIMPEYLFFHDLSEQGVLSWKQYQHILQNIPYQLAAERLFDEIGEEGAKEPATFVWCLTTK